MRRACLLLTAAGCRQVLGLADPLLEVDAAVDGRPTIDAAPNCIDKWLTTTGPTFGTPRRLGVSSNAAENDPFVTADGLTLYFARAFDIYRATRAATSEDFANPVAETALNTMSGETKLTLLPGGNEGFLTSSRPGGRGSDDLWHIYRATPGNWALDQMYMAKLNSGAQELDPHVSSDGLRIYFAPAATASTQTLAVATRPQASDEFGMPTEITAVNITGLESDPTLTGDERVLVYSYFANNQRDIWYTTRSSVSQSFGAPRALSAVNTTTFTEGGPHITPDGCTLYFESNAMGSLDLYVVDVQ